MGVATHLSDHGAGAMIPFSLSGAPELETEPLP